MSSEVRGPGHAEIPATGSLIGDYPDFAITEQGLGTAFVDSDEWQDKKHRMRVVHGGFRNSPTRFQFYFPDASAYQGRMVHFLEGGLGGHEKVLEAAAGSAWVFDFAFGEAGAYLVESNQGHVPEPGAGFDGDIQNFGASAESARFSWRLAEIIYGEKPHHSYVFGVSGGGCRTMSCIEYRPDVWDGAAPHLAPSGGQRGQFWAAAYFWLTCRHKQDEVFDALSPGGSGKPFALLTVDESDGLECALRHGLPRGAVNQVWPFRGWAWSLGTAPKADPYYTDFWTKPGYVGHDTPERVAKYIERFETRVKKVFRAHEMPSQTMATRLGSAGAVSALQTAVTLEDTPTDTTRLYGAVVTIQSGAAAGRVIPITEVSGDLLSVSPESDTELWNGVQPGDRVSIDNSAFVAVCHRWLHELELPEDGRFPSQWAGLSKWVVNGEPIHPQLPIPVIGAGEPANGHSGRFEGKVIHINCTHDGITWPSAALGWTRKVERARGDGIDAQYRLWWNENSAHVEPSLLPLLTNQKDPGKWQAQIVPYDGLTEEALRALIKWVEHGQAPLASTSYLLSDDGEVTLPAAAEERGGPQPVVTVTANGSVRAQVRAGEPVRLRGRAVLPRGAGSITRTSWDFDGSGRQTSREIPGVDMSEVAVDVTHCFDRPGTHFVTFHATGHSEGLKGRGLGVPNLARCRVVVEP